MVKSSSSQNSIGQTGSTVSRSSRRRQITPPDLPCHPDSAIALVRLAPVAWVVFEAAPVKPTPIPAQILRFDLWFMLAVTIALLASLIFRNGLSRGMAMVFVAAFCAYTALQYIGVERVFGGAS